MRYGLAFIIALSSAAPVFGQTAQPTQKQPIPYSMTAKGKAETQDLMSRIQKGVSVTKADSAAKTAAIAAAKPSK